MNKDLQSLPGFVNEDGYTLEQGLASVGNGWHSLVTEAFEKLPKGSKIIQVKEKFGGLRIYFEPYTVKYHKFIGTLEYRSYETCSRCGKDGKVGGNAWLVTLCESCRKDWEAERDS